MERAAALEQLALMTAANSVPRLSAAALDTLLDACRLADSAGHAPASADWRGAYDLNSAAAEGWRWKAAMTAAEFDFTADGATYNRAQVQAQCLKMAEHYRRRVVRTITAE